MQIIVLIVAVVVLGNLVLQAFKSFFTLSFLPHAIGMFDGNVSIYIIPIIGPTIGVMFNYLVAAFVNLVDFAIWLIHWIPGLDYLFNIVYTAPDGVERLFPNIFGGIGGHRNFITHSVLNPVFLIYLVVHKVSCKIHEALASLVTLIGLTFICHLLADTMPQAWMGAANIKIYLFQNWLMLPPLFSEIWLYMNAGLGLFLMFKIAEE